MSEVKKIATRESYGNALAELGAEYPNLVVLDADLAAATFVDLLRPDTRAGVQMLEAAGLLAEGRALEILDAQILPEERPQ